MSTSDLVDRSSWLPGTSPWERLLPYFTRLTQHHDLGSIFGGIRGFVVAACASPVLAHRQVHPSTINMAIFKTADPIDYSESYLHPRVIVSPRNQWQISIRYYNSQEQKPECRWASPLPDDLARVKLRLIEFTSGKPEPQLKWVCDPQEGIEHIRELFGD